MKSRGETPVKPGSLVRTAFLLALFPLAALPAYPEYDTVQSADSEAVPARIRALEGSVTLQRQQEQDRVEATINAPVFPGDQLRTDDGRAEVEFPDGSILWLDSETWVELLGVGDPQGETRDSTVLRLHEGTLEMDYRGGGSGSEEDPRIDTEESSVYLLGRGRFRIESDRGATTVVSFRGVAELAGDNGSVLVRSGRKSEVVRGSVPDDPRAVNTLRLDDFDQWCEERQARYLFEDDGRDREYVQAVPVPVRHYVTELDNYGDWQWMVNFGWVWRPTIYQVGWRPYFNGYWTWYPRGWTWVAYEPWGWVPYHYGRWNWVASVGWIWIPGGVYSGAWVSWAITPTYVGWCPLDFYNGPAYVNVNITNVTVNRYGGGWNFLPLNRFSDRSAARIIVKPDRVPHLDGAVTTRVLPRFSPEQVHTRPDVAQQVLREGARSQYRFELPERGNRQGLVPFHQADRREALLRGEAAQGRRSPSLRPTPSAPAGPRGESGTKPRPRAVSPEKIPRKAQDPGAVSGQSRGAGISEGKTESARPSRENDRQAKPRARDDKSVIRKESQGAPGGTKVRPRREPTPQAVPPESEDASRRVLNRIFGGNGTPARTPQSGARSRDEKAGPEKGQAPKQEVQGSRPRSSQPRASTPPRQSQPPKQEAAPPPKDEEKKKDKP